MNIYTFEQYIERVFYTFEHGDKISISTPPPGEYDDVENLGFEMFGDSLALYRGHSNQNWKLIPSIARMADGGLKSNSEVITIENKLISEFKRRRNISQKPFRNDLDLLIYAQHYGLETRLLDWSTNPLVALFFACIGNPENDGSVHMIFNKEEFNLPEDPLKINKVHIFPPDLNNERVVAQNGWFTIHPFHETKKNVFRSISEFVIPKFKKQDFLIRLDSLGINYESVFPGVEGTCKYINWKINSKNQT